MILIIFLFILSIFLDGVLLNLFSNFIFFLTLAVIVCTVNKINNNYFIMLFTIGIIYDLIYTPFIFLHGFIFLSLAYILKKIINKKDGFIKYLLMYVFTIVIYTIVMILFTFLYNNYNLYVLFKNILDSMLLNVLYFSLIYFVTNYLFCNTKKVKTY